MDFNFDSSFRRHSEREIKRITEETLAETSGEKDPFTLAATLSAKSVEVSLVVTRAVLQEYHEFLMKTLKESR